MLQLFRPRRRGSLTLAFSALLFLLLTASPLALAAEPTPEATADIPPPRAEQEITIRRGDRTAKMRPLQKVRTADGREAVAGRIIVGFHVGVDAAGRAAVHRAAGQRGRLTARAAGAVGREAHAVAVEGTASLEAAVQAYRADPRVLYAEPDYIARAAETPNDPRFASQWGMSKIGAPAAWEVTHGAPARTIAILDCGIYEQGSSTYENPYAPGVVGHTDLNGKVVAHRDFTGSAYGADDYCDHGSHVAGIAAAVTNNGNGVAGLGYSTRLLNGKVLGDDGSGAYSGIAQGIYWAADNGANVINMSLGGPGACSATLQTAIDYAWARNVVVVAAAGNDGASTPQQPANCTHVLAVASTTTGDLRSSFSNYGAWVDVAAPGSDILSTDYNGAYVQKSGTSMAAPHVAGLAGLLWGTGAFSSAQAVVDRITGTAARVTGSGSEWQYGRIDAAAALTGLVSPSPTPSPTPSPSPTPAPVTVGATTWYFAEGYTGAGFDEYLTIMNPNATAAAVRITYYGADGVQAVKELTAAPNARTTVAVHESAAGAGRGQAVGAKVESTNGVGIIAERPMYFTYGSITGGHNVMGATAPGTTWYFAEGYTGAGFDEYLTILNPGSTPAAVTITYYTAGGGATQRSLTVGAASRSTVAVHDAAQGVGRGQAVGAKVESTNGAGIIAERPMYFTYGTITGGHTVLGAPAPRQRWYFAEGYTGTGFDEYLTLLNPGDADAAVTVTYYLSGGAPTARSLTVPARSRATISVHDAGLGVGRDQAVSARVESTNGVGIVAERPIYFSYGLSAGAGGGRVTGGHNVMGAAAPRGDWYFAEGYTGPGFDEYLTIQNPNGSPAAVTLTYYLSSGATVVRGLTVAANARATVAVHEQENGVGRGQAVSVRVQTSHAGGIVVERPIYFRYGDRVDGGHDVLGYAP